MSRQPEVFIELHPSVDGWCARGRIEQTPDGLPRTFVGVLSSRDEAIAKSIGWALGWLRRLREIGT